MATCPRNMWPVQHAIELANNYGLRKYQVINEQCVVDGGKQWAEGKCVALCLKLVSALRTLPSALKKQMAGL